MRIFLTLICILSTSGLGANAATVTANAVSQASANPAVVPGAKNEVDTDNKTQSSTISPNLSSSTSAAQGTASASANSSVNSDTGVLRASVSTSGNRGDGFGDAGTVASANINESFSVVGIGTVTATMKLDGLWNLSRLDISPNDGITPIPFWQVQADVRLGLARDFVCIGTACSPSINNNNSGSLTDYILTTTLSVNSVFGPTIVNFSSQLFTQIVAGDGLIDFGNTAKILVEFSDGLTATPTDPDFLSDPAFNDSVSPIPLPPAALLLLSGLALPALLRRRQRSAASRQTPSSLR